MIYLLDTDHLSLIQRSSAAGRRIEERLTEAPAGSVYASIISYEEQTRGWFAELNRKRSYSEQEAVYAELGRMLDLYCSTPLLPFDGPAIAEFQRLWRMRLRVGTMDLKVAAIALANDATLLTRNTRDFQRVPALRSEDWSV